MTESAWWLALRSGASRTVAARRGMARMLAAVLLVPTLVLALSPEGARAASVPLAAPPTTFGPVVSGGFGWHNWLSYSNVECTFGAYYVTRGSDVSVRVAAGGCDYQTLAPGKDAEVQLHFNGTLANDAPCSYEGYTRLDEHGFAAEAGPVGGFAPSGCAVAEVCWDATKDTFGPGSWSNSGCRPLALGTPGPPAEAPIVDCLAGSGLKPVIATAPYIGRDAGATWGWYQDVKAQLRPGTTDRWALYVILSDTGGPSSYAPVIQGSVPSLRLLRLPDAPAGPEATVQVRVSSQGSNLQGQVTYTADRTIVGMGWVRNGGGTTNPNPTVDNTLFALPQVVSKGLLGVSDVTRCAQYWGDKIAEVPASIVDEPLGPVVQPGGDTGTAGSTVEPVAEPPAPDAGAESGCDGFSLTDSASWGGAAWCMVVKLLGQALQILQGIYNVLAAVVKAIAGIPGAILDGLSALFVPSSGFMDSKASAMKAVWSDQAPAKWMGALGALAPPSMTGCEGMPLDVNLGHGIAVDQHLGAACSGKSATAAGVVRIVLSAMLVIAGAVACIRGLGAGFGWTFMSGANPGGSS